MGLVSCLTGINWTAGKQLLVLTVILIGYLLIGAAVFEALEKPNEIASQEELQREIAQFANASGLNETQIRSFAATVSRLSTVASSANLQNWAFAPSFFFALTVITTIGYGQISPVTAGGQAFCCVYALFGIPIAGIMLVKIANRLKGVFLSLRDRLLKRLPKNSALSERAVPLFLGILGLVVFLFVPAVIFHAIENWTYSESLYYCFITLSTIGFGDYVPAQESGSNRNLYKILVMVWIFTGLAFLTLLLEIINDLLSKTAEVTSAAVRKMKDPSSSEDNTESAESKDSLAKEHSKTDLAPSTNVENV